MTFSDLEDHLQLLETFLNLIVQKIWHTLVRVFTDDSEIVREL